MKYNGFLDQRHGILNTFISILGLILLTTQVAMAGETVSPVGKALPQIDDDETTYSYQVIAKLYDSENDADYNQNCVSELTIKSIEGVGRGEKKYYYFSRYLLDGTTLYKTNGNGLQQTSNRIDSWSYGGFVVGGETTSPVEIKYYKIDGNYVCFKEIEDVKQSGDIITWGVDDPNITNWNDKKGRASALASNGAGVQRDGTNASIGVKDVSLNKGEYKITLGVFGSANSDVGTYSIKVGNDIVNSFSTLAGVSDHLVEYTTPEFTISSDNQSVDILHTGSQRIFLDYILIEKITPIGLSASLTGNIEERTEITLTAIPYPVDEKTLTGVQFQYKKNEGEWKDIATVSSTTFGQRVTQTFTPTDAGIYTFKTRAVYGENDYSEWEEISPIVVIPLTITYTLRDAEGHAVAGIDDVQLQTNSGVDFTVPTSFQRQFCQYSFYSDAGLANEVTERNEAVDQSRTVYVKWEYNEYAPVFSQGDNPDEYQYYTLYNHYYAQSGDTYVEGVQNDWDDVGNASIQWAFVGNPYSVKIYNRSKGKFVYSDGVYGHQLTFDKEENATTWTMPKRENEKEALLQIDINNDKTYWNADSSQEPLSNLVRPFTLKHIIVPLKVYKADGSTLVDIMEYMLDYPDDGATMSSSLLTNTYHGNHIYKHAFCEYTFYTDAKMNELLPKEGTSFFGGTSQQYKAIYATYEVDKANFSQIYLIDWKSGDSDFFMHNDNLVAKCTTAYKQNVKDDKTQTYRWQLTGDPYSLQLTNLSVGDNYQDIPLSSEALNTSLSFSTDAASRKNYIFEAIEVAEPTTATGETTYHVYFYLVPNSLMTTRYGGGISFDQNNNYVLEVKTTEPTPFDLITALPQHPVTWHVIFEGSEVATLKEPLVTEGRTLTIDNMPESLKRHYVTYTGLYTDAGCTEPAGSYTVGTDDTNDGQHVYVKGEYANGHPTFYTSSGDDVSDAWYMMHIGDQLLYANATTSSVKYDDDAHVKVDKDDDAYLWRLVGTPYGVRLYNKSTKSYLTFPSTTTGETLTLTEETGTILYLMDDYTADLAAICYMEDGNMVYANKLAHVNPDNTSGYTSAEFLSTNGIEGLTFVLHYSDATLRPGLNNDRKDIISITGYQSVGKRLINVLPDGWKRAYCQYSFVWKDGEVKTITTEMTSGTQIDVYYDYQEASDFNWSTQKMVDGKISQDLHWYYVANRHALGQVDGNVLYLSGEKTLRMDTGISENNIYTNNFEWAVIGDPYGFRLLNHYDPDQDQTLYMTKAQLNPGGDYTVVKGTVENSEGTEENVFEMRLSDFQGAFWIHPVYGDGLREEPESNISYFTADGLSSAAYPKLVTEGDASSIRQIDIANFVLRDLTNASMREYLYYAGFVGAFTEVAVKNDSKLKAMKTKVDNGNSLTSEEAEYVRRMIEETDVNGELVNLVQMKQGYYRIVPYIYEKSTVGKIDPYIYEKSTVVDNETDYENPPAEGRRYVRGYLYGDGTGGNTYGSDQEYDYNTKTAFKSLMSNEKEADAQYDPASIFLFKKTTNEDGKERYEISTQGLNLNGPSLTGSEAFPSRYENIGSVLNQLYMSNDEYSSNHYLSYVQDFNGNEPVTARRMALEACFEKYGFTRLYLQPVGNGMGEMPFKKSCTFASGNVFEDDDYYYTTLYVPFDVILPDGAVAFLGVEENRATANDYRLRCWSTEWYDKVEHLDANGVKVNNDRFVHAGVPVVIRVHKDKINTSELEVEVYGDEPSKVPEDITNKNLLKGSYLTTGYSTEAGFPGLNTDELVYVFTKSNKDRVGFFRNNTTVPDGYDTWLNPNIYIQHNRIFYIYERQTSGSASPLYLSFEDGTPDDIGVQTVSHQQDDSWYNPQGVRLRGKPSQPGLYIHNGQKITVK